MLYVAFIICVITSLCLTPLVKKLAIKIGATDSPNERKVHITTMPRLGGIGIFTAFVIGYLLIHPESDYALPILGGSFIVVLTGILDDIFCLSAKVKFIAQMMAAIVIISGGIEIQFINLPFDQRLYLGWFSIPITIIWIIGITNAINLIDGLDGLAAGVSCIVLLTIAGLSVVEGNYLVFGISLVMLGSTLGFMPFNFHPAKIFMGDGGAYLLGYIIAILSLLGFKNVTMFSIVVPIIILAVPISDTLFAIIRRIVKKKPFTAPDKSHLHHRLMRFGFTHRESVMLIYGMSAFFGLSAIIFSKSTLFGACLIISFVLFAIEIVVEAVGLVDSKYRPILNIYRRILGAKKIP